LKYDILSYHGKGKSGGDHRYPYSLDALIAADRFPNRSQTVEAALADKIDRVKHIRLAREAAKLDPRQEQAEADEGLTMDAATWPKY
jgi:Arc/MetJ-type ribon-helix-helix transcriptional regulator